jgi:hypothetical protein
MRTFAFMPNAMMVKVDLPKGITDTDSELSRALFELDSEPIFVAIPQVEKESLFTSLYRTYERCQYHYYRFKEIEVFLSSTRKNLPTEISYDASLKYMYFEIQALFGSIRLFLDEILYIVARKYGETHEHSFSGSWKVNNVFKSIPPNQTRNHPEIIHAANYADWYVKLNGYRNAFYHHGWNYSSGHSDNNELGSRANSPQHNGFFAPDLDSLKQNSKPFQWTWNDKTQISDIVENVKSEFEEFIENLVFTVWAVTKQDYSGATPILEQPNVIVSFPFPCVLLYQSDIVIPVFTTLDKAESYTHFQDNAIANNAKVEIVQLKKNKLINPKNEYFTVGISGLERLNFEEENENSRLQIVVNAEFDNDGNHKVGTGRFVDLISLAEVKKDIASKPISFYIPETDPDVIYIWRKITHL